MTPPVGFRYEEGGPEEPLGPSPATMGRMLSEARRHVVFAIERLELVAWWYAEMGRPELANKWQEKANELYGVYSIGM